ncbi:DUF1993 domain-containing protein [Croceicoccus bisphenolivorans]|uniref:DUF1993 domain-containing protein n=1 Tax=Croceicoccus bisphenolivorans TaxID=1783232 RepID=UPI00082EBCC4|nr:DUF1993 domain-containing protein [Croceicoccus bisphenolivorans]
MPITLYDAFVPTCLQQLGAVAGLIDKAEAFCEANGWEPSRIINARLAPDMNDFAYQVKSCHTHSKLAIEGAKAGTFGPELSEPPQDFDGLRTKISDAVSALQAIDPAELEALIGKDAEFRFNDFVLPFTAEHFLLSFSLPNFQFHATTAYALLRHLGVEIGKRDYIGALRLKTDQ